MKEISIKIKIKNGKFICRKNIDRIRAVVQHKGEPEKIYTASKEAAGYIFREISDCDRGMNGFHKTLRDLVIYTSLEGYVKSLYIEGGEKE